MDTKLESTRAIHAPTAGRLTKPFAVIKRHIKLLTLVAVVLVVGALAFMWWSRRDTAGEYLTDKVTRGAIEVDVSATGTVQAVTTVQVGSQVSGAVSWLGADFKSHVSQGQVIAKLDPALFQAQVDTAKANVANAQAGVQAAMTDINNQKANIEAAKANDAANKAARDDAVSIAKQDEKLKGVIPDRDIESAENAAKVAVARYSQAVSQVGQAQAQLQISQSKLKQAQAEVAQANAQLEQANVNLQHTIISSPIEGVVVSRSVDVGQTVAASLSAPTLFTIANDLTNMQVLASIDEADVGQVREQGSAHFTVDAFPRQTFTGQIVQVRLNAQTLQNVVTYTAVINVANPDQKLMPGMTANITIPVARREDVLKVPNAALRFKPDLSDQQQKDLQAKIDAFRQQQQQAPGEQQAAATQPSDKAPGDQPAASASGKKRHQQKTQTANAAAPSPNDNQNSTAENTNGSGKHRHRDQAANSSDQQATDNTNGGKKSGTQAASGGKGGGQHRHQQDANSSTADKSKPPADQQSTSDKSAPAGNQNSASGGGGASRGGSGKQIQIQVIWILTATKTLEARIVRIGITDGRTTEIVASDIELKEGDTIVTGQSDGGSNSNRSPQSGSPFGQQRPAGAGGGRAR